MLIILVFLVKSLQIFIKNYERDIFICLDKATSLYAIGCSKDKAADVRIDNNSEKNSYIKLKQGNKVLDIAGGITELIFWAFHGGINQQFDLSLMDKNKFKIKYRGKCIEYQESLNRYFVRECQEDKNQYFTLYDQDEEFRKQEELRKQEEELRRQEELRKQEELKKQEELRKEEELRKQEESRKEEEMKRRTPKPSLYSNPTSEYSYPRRKGIYHPHHVHHPHIITEPYGYNNMFGGLFNNY